MLETVLQAVVENYDEYRDYNTTTTQSDYGENLFVLLDFLRLKTAYERDNWRMRPLVLVHEILCRRDRVAEVHGWETEIVEYTREHAARHLSALADLEARHGIKLRTVGDRLRERFVAPLAVDRMCALVGPAREAADPNGDGPSPAFTRLHQEVERFTAIPTGVGLDVPVWLRRLEVESYRLRQEPTRETQTRSRLTAEELRTQLSREWGGSPDDS
jgi:hypothetical protein